MSGPAHTYDGFLNRRIVCGQPRQGFRAGHDTVFLAAAVPAAAGERVLELGAGAGVASLCLAARVPECRIDGVEIDPDLVLLANANALRNAVSDRVRFIAGDARDCAPESAPFDHVFLNPPFHPATGQSSPYRPRDLAMRDRGNAAVAWTARACHLVRREGSVSIVLRADQLGAWRANLTGAVTMRPLVPRAGDPPKRVVAHLRPGRPASFSELPPVILHEADGRPTAEADAVLRDRAALSMA